ncbi:transcription antitermination factor NusB [Patescibacteria group bacterium]|nr:transcription antitermination factor NusB [Patescibacteria group bacterium]
MSKRRLSRTIALQTLSEWDFNASILKNDIDIKKIHRRNIIEFAPNNFTTDFSEKLYINTLKNIKKIDNYIKKYAPQWPLEQITIIDRNILRLGILELIFLKNTPPKVIINEAIEIAKAFGGETSSKFINGVLGAVYEKYK